MVSGKATARSVNLEDVSTCRRGIITDIHYVENRGGIDKMKTRYIL